MTFNIDNAHILADVNEGAVLALEYGMRGVVTDVDGGSVGKFGAVGACSVLFETGELFSIPVPYLRLDSNPTKNAERHAADLLSLLNKGKVAFDNFVVGREMTSLSKEQRDARARNPFCLPAGQHDASVRAAVRRLQQLAASAYGGGESDKDYAAFWNPLDEHAGYGHLLQRGQKLSAAVEHAEHAAYGAAGREAVSASVFASASASAHAPAQPLAKGCVCVCENMRNTPDLEGVMGIVHSFDEAAGRWTVKLETGQAKALKTDKLRYVDAVGSALAGEILNKYNIAKEARQLRASLQGTTAGMDRLAGREGSHNAPPPRSRRVVL